MGTHHPALKYRALISTEEASGLLSYYYLARVQTNAELYPEAVKSCLRAEASAGDGGATDDYQARLYSQMAEIYLKQFALDKAIESSKNARAISVHLDNPQFYIHNSLDLASLLAAKGMSEESRSIADSLETWIGEKGLDCPPAFYETVLRIEVDRKPVDTARISKLYDGYKESVADNGLSENPVTVCRVESALGNYAKARDAIGAAVINAGDSFAAAGLYSTLSRLHESLGEYETALEYRYKYDDIVEGLHQSVFNNDVRFLQERYEAERKSHRQDIIRYILAAGIILLITIVLAVILRQRQNKKEYERSLIEAQLEYNLISRLLEEKENTAGVKDILEQRLKALRPFIGPGSYTAKAIVKRNSSKDILESIGFLCALTHPGYVDALSKCDLTPEEIGICALYAYDYRPKQMATIIGESSLYHKNSVIREKMKISGTNLTTVLAKIFEETENRS